MRCQHEETARKQGVMMVNRAPGADIHNDLALFVRQSRQCGQIQKADNCLFAMNPHKTKCNTVWHDPCKRLKQIEF
jgi:hypothetical protein